MNYTESGYRKLGGYGIDNLSSIPGKCPGLFLFVPTNSYYSHPGFYQMVIGSCLPPLTPISCLGLDFHVTIRLHGVVL
jgi:hypothetical protein